MGVSPVVFRDTYQFRCKSKYIAKYSKVFKKSGNRTENRQIFFYFTVLLLDRRIQIYRCSCIYCYIDIRRYTALLGVSWELSREGNLFQ